VVSIIIPYVRWDGYERCLNAIFKNAGDVEFEVVSEEDVDRIGCPKMVNFLVRKSKYDLVCFMHDDSVPKPGFLEQALKVMQTFDRGWGCVGLNDKVYGPEGPCTHWLIHKKMLQYFPDGFACEDYRHTRWDRELQDVCTKHGRYKWAEYAVVGHRNPYVCPGAHFDETFLYGYNADNLKHDAEVYEKRRGE